MEKWEEFSGGGEQQVASNLLGTRGRIGETIPKSRGFWDPFGPPGHMNVTGIFSFCDGKASRPGEPRAAGASHPWGPSRRWPVRAAEPKYGARESAAENQRLISVPYR